MLLALYIRIRTRIARDIARGYTPVLVCAMFAVEYVVRYRVFPDWERVSVLGGIQAFSRHFAAQPQSPR